MLFKILINYSKILYLMFFWIYINYNDFREYSMVLVIKPTSTLAKKTVEQAGISRQPGLTLLQIQREGQSFPNPLGDFQMHPKDHMLFTGVIDSILSLTQLDGLALSEDEVINANYIELIKYIHYFLL